MSSNSFARRDGDHIALPGIASAHSHAFQRALRARTQRRETEAASFWSWRALMYELAAKVGPEEIFDLSRYAFLELALAGVTAVGEFHYVHHDPSGQPYSDRLELADSVVRAAREIGLRITLLRVVYQRGGAEIPAEGAQLRFCDRDVGAGLEDVLALQERYRREPLVRVGLAPHSVRAVTKEGLTECARFADTHSLPLHTHVAEQRREIESCVAEHRLRPVELLADLGVLGPRFVAVHATHLTQLEARSLASAGSFACICRTTERDLGDGLPDIAALHASGARLCVGADSHASSDPFEEARAIELDERSRTEVRNAALDATDLMRALGPDGYASLGWAGAETEDEVRLDALDPAHFGSAEEGPSLEDAVIWGASPRAVHTVRVGGQTIVERGAHAKHAETCAGYRRALRRLGL